MEEWRHSCTSAVDGVSGQSALCPYCFTSGKEPLEPTDQEAARGSQGPSLDAPHCGEEIKLAPGPESKLVSSVVLHIA
jgi:hypothetical protein